jgi:hypothetical protein
MRSVFGVLLLLPFLAMPAAAQTSPASGDTAKPAPATIEAGEAPTEVTAPPRPLGMLANLQTPGTASAASPPRVMAADRGVSAGGHP